MCHAEKRGFGDQLLDPGAKCAEVQCRANGFTDRVERIVIIRANAFDLRERSVKRCAYPCKQLTRGVARLHRQAVAWPGSAL